MRSAVIVFVSALALTACRPERSIAPLPGGSGMTLDLRYRQRCMNELSVQASGMVAPDQILREIAPYSVEVKTPRDAQGLCRDHWGIGGAQANECANRLMVLVGLAEPGPPANPCASAY